PALGHGRNTISAIGVIIESVLGTGPDCRVPPQDLDSRHRDAVPRGRADAVFRGRSDLARKGGGVAEGVQPRAPERGPLLGQPPTRPRVLREGLRETPEPSRGPA